MPKPLMALVLLLGGLVLLTRFGVVGSEGSPAPAAAPVEADTAEALPPQRIEEPNRRIARAVVVAQPRAPTPTLDLMVRLEALRRVTRAGQAVYLDSLLAETDSLLRRWPDRPGHAITVALVQDSVFVAERVDQRPIREAFAEWQELRLGVEFSFVTDTTAAEVTIRWIGRFEEDERRTGQTDLVLDSDGVIHHARVTLSLRDPDGRILDRNALATTALHEVGHVLGLSHSARSGDIMHPSPTVPRLSDRDRRTIELIYGLPPGSIKSSP